MRANRNSPRLVAGIYPLGHQVDHAVAAFLNDVRERSSTSASFGCNQASRARSSAWRKSARRLID
jgi:hypothetical protein